MAIFITTSSAPVTSPVPSFTQLAARLLTGLIAWETRWCEAQRMEQLTNEERRDMGLPCHTVLPRLPDYGW
ncbi:MAG: hypothetical protein ACSHXI_04655 [Hoeflea sp.]|uniref:hypothetical protein n=1 Tax=Hoeflea sp. TaxID=1940281 RepID=UPI003EF0F8F8